jgi:hypothetical protein
MAKGIRYTAGAFHLEHVCGHTEIHELTGRHESLVEQIAALESLPCAACVLLLADATEIVETPATAAEATAAISTLFAGMEKPFVAAEWEGPEHLFHALSEFCEILEYPVPTHEAVAAFWRQAAS